MDPWGTPQSEEQSHMSVVYENQTEKVLVAGETYRLYRVMSEEQQQSQAGDTFSGATPMRRPESYWRSRAEAAASTPNPMYASNAGTIPMQQPQSLRSRDDAAAKVPNPMYTSNAGATRMRRSLSYWRSRANAAAKMLNPMYASSSADSPMHQPQTDNQARASNDENTPDVMYANIPDDPPMNQPKTDNQARANDDKNAPDGTQATIPDGAYPGGASGRRGVCSFLRARRICLAAGIAVLLGLVAVGLTFSNKQEISQLSTTVKRDLRQLATTFDALKRDQDDMRQQSATVDTLKRDQDDMSTTVDALKRDQDALKCDQDTLRQLFATVDALKRDLNNERNRIATLEQHLNEKTLRYTIWRGICYKAFDTKKSFSGAAAACRADGGTLAIPRDAETDAFLISLCRSVSNGGPFWFGLHDQREEGRFEWMDGSALGPYSSWGPEQPNNNGDQDCVLYSARSPWRNKKSIGDRRECHHDCTAAI
ncbi:hypothetical protein Bbelb_253200 [Branchiostoma belcheri]|nr:hypothetical protein Bbelb_253200 [Branchiostoma belcheri]